MTMRGGLALLGSTDLAAVTKAADFLRETTWGAIDLVPAVYPGTVSASCTDTAAVYAEADEILDRLGVPPPARVIIANKSGCSFTGKGEIGGRHVILAGAPTTSLLAHELGHTLTLPHNITPLSDTADPMSVGWRHWNAKHRGQIEWYLSTGGFDAVWPNGCFWDHGCEWPVSWDLDAEEGREVLLSPPDHPPGADDVVAARVPADLTSTGRVSRYISFEYRRPVGFDAGLVTPRVAIHLSPPYNSFLTVKTLYPGATQYLGSLKSPGEVWEDPVRGIRLRLVSIDAEHAVVVATRGMPIPVDEVAPSVELTYPLDGAVVARQSVVTLAARASDLVGVTRIDFLVDGVTVASRDVAGGVATATAPWTVPRRRNRTYRIVVQAGDDAGNVGVSTPVTVTAR